MKGVHAERRAQARKRRGLGGSFLAVFGLALVAACSTGGGDGSPAPGSAPAPAAPSAYVTLERAAHPLARPEFDLGRLDGAKVLHNMSLVFELTPAQKADRDALLAEIQRPGSPSYHRWLTPQDYAARFGADADTIAQATAWLAAQGFTVHERSPIGARATFTGTVAQVEAAFQTEMHAYDVRGERHFAMARPPSVPAEFADRVLDITNTHDFYPHHSKPAIRVVTPDATCPGGDPYCSGNGIAPPDWAFIYDVGPLYNPGINSTKITGAGVTIMVVGITDVAQKDLTAFRTRYGLAANNIVKTVVPNTGAAQGDNGAGAEAVLDTEWAGGIAPGATINYVYTGANDANVDDATFYAIEQNFGGVLSESWGGCEEGAAPADGDVYEVYGAAASLEGISYLAASGDDGAADCQGKGGLWVNMPASLPHVTGVGGTGFAMPAGLTFTGGNVSGVGTEATWNEANNAYMGGVGASGGGISAVYSRPLYQSKINTCMPVGTLPTMVNPASQRQVPDVSFTAAGGTSQYGIFIECTFDAFAGDCTNTGANPTILEIGGTSASTPSFAGVVALANQATGGRLGNINPLLYATNLSVPAAFHDVTTGNNEVVCRTGDTGCPGNNKTYGYTAGPGYDCATGLGSVDATKLVSTWATLTPTTTAIGAAPTATTEGGSVTLTATVDVDGTNAQALGGDVTFVFRSYITTGVLDLSWSMGDVAITNGTTTSGTATLTTTIPPGMVQPNQAVDVFAMYGGDANHLPSYSAAQHITFSSPVTLCISPPTDSVAKGATINYTAAGGVAPVRWYLDWDSTCSATTGTGCSTIDVTKGTFVAGSGAAGYVIVVAVDADGAETFSEVTVGGGSGTVPWSAAGPSNYAGILVSKTALKACPAGNNCGTVPDGCGGIVTCPGTCTAPQTCGGGGTPNVCGSPCMPKTTCPAGDNCGTVSDGCSGTITCGTCTAPQTCGGGGTPNVCGCTPLKACPAGDNCGTVSDGCGGTLTCGTCTAPQTCTANVCGCMPLTACPAGDNCGTVSDGCGGTLNCGTCTAPQTCTANVCGCKPLTACPAGDNCGTVSDGCGGTLTCGTCTAPQTCGGTGTANVCGCKPLTACPAGDNCGTVPDGCGGTVNCGTCTAPQTCTANVCGCKPLTACPAGDNCGTVPDGCGGTLNCGTCTAPQTCTANVCGCKPLTACPAGDNCGTVSDGCGGTVNCGTCTAPQTCTANVCGCKPLTACPAGDNCGTVPDGCGGTLMCGTCTAPQSCGGSGTPNLCGCTPLTACPAGDNCGAVPDGCGGMLTCGTCGASQVCTNNQCVSTSTSSSSSSGTMSGSTSSGAGTGGTSTSSGSTSSSAGASTGGSGTTSTSSSSGAGTGGAGTTSTSSSSGTGTGGSGTTSTSSSSGAGTGGSGVTSTSSSSGAGTGGSGTTSTSSSAGAGTGGSGTTSTSSSSGAGTGGSGVTTSSTSGTSTSSTSSSSGSTSTASGSGAGTGGAGATTASVGTGSGAGGSSQVTSGGGGSADGGTASNRGSRRWRLQLRGRR